MTIRYCVESFYFILLNVLRSVGGGGGIACGRDGDPLFTLVQAVDTDFSDGVRERGLKMCERCKGDFAEAIEVEVNMREGCE
jgi:hypothetical protein